MFQGASSISLDAKGWPSVPPRCRELLSATATGQFTTQHSHGCPMMFPRPELCAAAGITRAAVLPGTGGHFELWDAETCAAQEAEAMKGELPTVLKDFSF